MNGLARDGDLLTQQGEALRRLLFVCRPYASENAHTAITRFFGVR